MLAYLVPRGKAEYKPTDLNISKFKIAVPIARKFWGVFNRLVDFSFKIRRQLKEWAPVRDSDSGFLRKALERAAHMVLCMSLAKATGWNDLFSAVSAVRKVRSVARLLGNLPHLRCAQRRDLYNACLGRLESPHRPAGLRGAGLHEPREPNRTLGHNLQLRF